MHKRYLASKRHTIQVDFEDYLWNLDKERKLGAERAAARGYALPVPHRAKDAPRTASAAVAA